MEALRLIITLEDIEPVIWRRVLVPSQFNLNGLHRVIQAAFGWQDYHLHRFEIEHVRYENPDLVEWDPPGREWCQKLLADGVDPAEVQTLCTPPADERRMRLRDLSDRGIKDFEYLYDFGDDWWHHVHVEKVEEADSVSLPAMIDGARSGPPEDCGGLPGYEQIQDAFAGEPVDDWGRELAGWTQQQMGAAWTPEYLDTELAQARVARTWRGPRR
jgi:hypothetical protein